MEHGSGLPATNQTQTQLRQLKPPGKTYDEFLQESIRQKRCEELASDVKAVFEHADDPAAVISALERGEFDSALSLMGLSNADAQAFVEDWQREATQLLDDSEQ